MKKARKTLGKRYEKYTDEQIEDIIGTFTVLADIAVARALEKRKT